ncbi:hypothetical protein J4216_05140 [Candidatus Woesearchaeota archaeon]|nr:hypothetical protein [Candidatus Woesearchaeota archaeon]
MPEVKTIKGIDDETWTNFKSLAAKDNVKLATLLKNMLKEYEKGKNIFWKDILKGKRIFTEEEAEKIEDLIRKKRKEYGFRS